MDEHSLQCLDFEKISELLSRYALTGLGRKLALGIQPITRFKVIERWHIQVREYQKLSEQRGAPPFGGMADVREVIKRCTPPLRVTVEEVAAIGDALHATHHLAKYLANLPDEYPQLQHLAKRIGDFDSVAQRIRGVIDERGEVRDDASAKLNRIRHDIDRANRQIRETVDRLLRDANVRRLLQFPNPTFHNDRIVLPLRTEYRGRLPGIVHRASDTGATLYVEPATVVELNNIISNLRSEEYEEINRLLWELAHEVHLNETEILKTMEALAVLDLIVAKARFARDFELRIPSLVADGKVSVRGARHPLLVELFRRRNADAGTDEKVVPIDYRIGDDFNLLIITGPNTGGKTVTLKTVGLLQLMVQAGLPVPIDEGGTFGVFNNVLIDIGDEQNMQQSLSTFSAHMKRMMEMLRRAGPQTLVLVDELGAGTDPDEGAAIGRAILDELARLEVRCIVTTHLGALKGYALQRRAAENASVEFDVETLRPTYHLRIGEAGASNAIEIARRLGMPKRLTAAARRALSQKGRALRDALAQTRTVKRDAESARQQAEDARLAADRAQTEADTARASLRQKEADFEKWVQRVVHLQPGDAVRVRGFDRDGKVVRLRLDQHRAEVDVGAFAVEVALGDVLPPETPAPPPRAEKPVVVEASAGPKRRKSESKPARGRGRERGRRESGGGQKPKPAVPSLSDAAAAQLGAGDRVYAKRFHREGTIVRVLPEKRLAVVNVGLLEVEVPFEGLGAAGSKGKGGGGRRGGSEGGSRRGRGGGQKLPSTQAPGGEGKGE